LSPPAGGFSPPAGGAGGLSPPAGVVGWFLLTKFSISSPKSTIALFYILHKCINNYNLKTNFFKQLYLLNRF
jgi:hypothetical protein